MKTTASQLVDFATSFVQRQPTNGNNAQKLEGDGTFVLRLPSTDWLFQFCQPESPESCILETRGSLLPSSRVAACDRGRYKLYVDEPAMTDGRPRSAPRRSRAWSNTRPDKLCPSDVSTSVAAPSCHTTLNWAPTTTPRRGFIVFINNDSSPSRKQV